MLYIANIQSVRYYSANTNYYWRDGTFDALEELRKSELNGRSYGYGL